MNLDPVCCPYCNAPIDLVSGQGERGRCSRCGEVLPGTWRPTAGKSPSLVASNPDTGLSPASRSTRKTAGILLILMLGMAAVGAVFALNTWKLRESRHPKPLLPAASGPESYPAAELPGLGYLPADTNVVAGIHVSEIRRDKAAAALLTPPLPGLLAQASSLVETRTGIKLANVEHLVLGTTLHDQIPQLTMVVETVQPYNVDLLSRLYNQKAIPQHNRPLFRVKLEPLGGGYVWCAEPRTLVILLRPDAAKIEDMDRIPGVPRKGAEGLPSGLRELIEKRLQRSVLWAAGDLPNASFVSALADFTSLPPTETALLKNLRGFAIGLLVQENLTIVGAVKASDRKHALAWKDYLETLRWPDVKDKKLLSPPAAGPESAWFNVQIRAEPEAVRAILNSQPIAQK